MADVKKKDEGAIETPEELDEFMADEPADKSEGEGFIEEAPPPAPDVPVEGGEMLDIAADVPVQVVVVMGKRNITLKEIASMRLGEVIELNRPANEMVDLVAGGRLIAKGELVEIEGKLGVRIVKMMK